MDGCKVYQESEINIHINMDEDNSEKGFMTVSDSVKSIGVKIEAARSGRINRNSVIYTPKAMDNGMLSFIEPFNKHLQSRHNGKAVGVIKEAVYVEEYFPNASDEFIEIVRDLKQASENSDRFGLVAAVKRLIRTKEYNSPEYKGLGIANIRGEIHDPNTIYQIRTKDSSKGKVSIGGQSREVYCSICSGKGSDTHIHQRGKTYANELCFYIHNDLELDHCGFVTEPADLDTNTEIVKDEKQNDLVMDVLNYTDNYNNSAEQTMNLKALKQKINDQKAVEALIAEYIPDQTEAAIATKEYNDSLENSKPNHFLFSADKFLNIKTPVGLFLADKLLADLEPSTEKDFIEQSFNTIKKAKNITDTDAALKDLLEGKKAEQELKDAVKDDDKETDKETDKEKPEVVSDSVKNEDSEYLGKFMAKLGVLFDTKIKELKEAVTVEDSLQTEYAKQELETLRQTLDTDQLALDQMSGNYKQSLIDQIILLKDNNISEDYLNKLTTRSPDQLKATIEDLRELRDLDVGNKETEKELPVPKTTEDAINKVKDQFEGADPGVVDDKTPDEKDKPEDKPEDKTEDKPNEANPVEVKDDYDPEQAFRDDCKIMSLTAAYKKHEKYLNTKRK